MDVSDLYQELTNEDTEFIRDLMKASEQFKHKYAHAPAWTDDHIIRKIEIYTDPLPPPSRFVRKGNYRNQPLLSNHRQDSIVAPRPSSSGVDEDVNRVVEWNTRRRLREHDIQVDSPEDLLEGIEGEPGQLRLDQVGPVLHDSLQLEMPVAALPPGDQMEHVGAVSGLPVLPALGAGQSHAEHIEEGEIRGLVTHLDQASVE